MRGEVAIAEREPRRRAVGGHRREAAKRLVGATPATAGVQHPTQRIHYRVEIGRDVQAPYLRVVPGVDDDAQRGGIEDGRETTQELGGPGAAGERRDAHAAP